MLPWILGALGLTGGGIGIAALLGGGPAMLAFLPSLVGLKSVGTSVLTFLAKLNPWQLALIALGLFALVQHFELVHARKQAVNYSRQLERCTSARHADQLAYTQAQAQAQAKNLAAVESTKRQQQEITDARVADLNSRLQLLARELRDNPSAKGSAGSTPVPETGPASCRAYDPAWLCLSPSDRLLAAQNEERHDQLITWNQQQSVVDPNER